MDYHNYYDHLDDDVNDDDDDYVQPINVDDDKLDQNYYSPMNTIDQSKPQLMIDAIDVAVGVAAVVVAVVDVAAVVAAVDVAVADVADAVVVAIEHLLNKLWTRHSLIVMVIFVVVSVMLIYRLLEVVKLKEKRKIK